MTEAEIKLFGKRLNSTNRAGANEVFRWLLQTDFFTAPASAGGHDGCEGGLVHHSNAVATLALELRKAIVHLRPGMEKLLPEQSVMLVSLLHDVCKVNTYTPHEGWAINEQGRIQRNYSYKKDISKLPFGHGEKSVILLLQQGLQLDDEEILAIRWHMGAWELAPFSGDAIAQFNKSCKEHPLTLLLQCADMMAANYFG